MTQQPKLVEVTPPEKAPRPVKVRLEWVNHKNFVDAWRLIEASLKEGGQTYPDTSEDSLDDICSKIFNYSQMEAFRGLIAKIGKRPVGVLFWDKKGRAFGRPSRFSDVYAFWIHPQFRKKGVGKTLWLEFLSTNKKENIFHWESKVHEHLYQFILEEMGFPVQRFLSIIGGRI